MSPGRGGELLNRWRFRVGDMFPGDDPIAHFLTVLGASLNDLLFVNRMIVEREHMERLGAGEFQYLLRASSAHVWELALLVKDAERDPAVGAFLRRVDDQALPHLSAIRDLANVGNDPRKKAIAHLRNKATWHYARPRDRSLAKALTKVADFESAIEFGETMGTIRSVFADEAMVQFMVQPFGVTTDDDAKAAVESLNRYLSDLAVAAIHLTQHLFIQYLGLRPVGAVAFEGPLYDGGAAPGYR